MTRVLSPARSIPRFTQIVPAQPRHSGTMIITQEILDILTAQALAVEYLGMPVEAMPFYSSQKRWSREAGRICSFVIRVGNFGHNRDMSYYAKRPYVVRKAISFRRRFVDALNHLAIFPLDTLRFFPSIVFNGIRSAIRREG